ncbi:MAG: hypothetical protein WCI72_04585 [archaeon]
MAKTESLTNRNPEEPVSPKYNVVFEYIGEKEGYLGTRTYTVYKSEEDFKKSYNEDIQKRYKAIAKGVTREEAINICAGVSLETNLRACVEGATEQETGLLNPNILRMNMINTFMARENSAEEAKELLKIIRTKRLNKQ